MYEGYHSWWWRPKRMTRMEIQEMVRNMKKSDIVNKKSQKYHKNEEIEADAILKKLDDKNYVW